MIPIAKPIIGIEEQNKILEVLASGQWVQGPRVQEFEKCFAEFCGAQYAVATSSGTSALHVAVLAHQIGPSDEVITSPFSFIASANCVLFAGARPVFVDIEPKYFTLDPGKIEERITERTKAIIPIHLYGQACDMEPILAIAQKYQLVVIQDACQAHGARYRGQPLGSFGTACYSLYATKNMTTIEGGMIITNDAEVADRARLIRNHGSRKPYEHLMLGYNMRMTDLAAAMGLVQLRRVPEWNTIRRANASYLTAGLSQVQGVMPPSVRPDAEHVFHQYTIRIAQRDDAAQRLRELGIGAAIHYPMPIHKQPLYQEMGYRDDLPVAEAASREVLSLPVHPSLTQADLDCILEAVADVAS